MKEIFNSLESVLNAASLSLTIFSAGGERVFSVGENLLAENSAVPEKNLFKNGVYSDTGTDVTYFLINSGKESYNAILRGADGVSRNYALMLSRLAESAFLNYTKEPSKEDKFRMLFTGGLSALNYEQLKSSFQGKGFEFFVLSIVVNPPKRRGQVIDFLTAMSSSGDIVAWTDERTVAYIADNNSKHEYSSVNDFAYILYENIREEINADIKIGVGGLVKKFDDLKSSYGDSLFAYNFGIILNPKSCVYSYKEYVMIKLISEVQKDRLGYYLETLLEKPERGVFKDTELMETADMFMKNSLNISETSRNMFMHRNTLIYRLDKIEKDTGLNIRHFNDAVVFRLINILNRLLDE